MCHYCAESEVWGEPFEPEEGGEDEYQCEWIEGTDGDDGDVDAADVEPAELYRCHGAAVHLVSERFVDAHLCAQHRLSFEKDLEEGLGALLEEAGLQEEVEFLPIEVGTDFCEYVDPRQIGPANEVVECVAPAVFARRIVTTSLLCDDHAEEAGYAPDG